MKQIRFIEKFVLLFFLLFYPLHTERQWYFAQAYQIYILQQSLAIQGIFKNSYAVYKKNQVIGYESNTRTG